MVNIAPIKMVLTGGWFIIVLPTLQRFHVLFVSGWLAAAPLVWKSLQTWRISFRAMPKKLSCRFAKTLNLPVNFAWIYKKYEEQITIVAECHRPHISPTPVRMGLGCMVLASFVTPTTHHYGVHRSTPLRSCIPSSWSTWTSSWSTQAAWQMKSTNCNHYWTRVYIYICILIILYIHMICNIFIIYICVCVCVFAIL